MLLLLEVGRRMAIRKRAKVWEKEPAGIAAAEGVVLPLFGLLVAFDLPRVGRKVHKYRELVGSQTLGFAVVTVTTVFVVLNIEFPRQGLFRANADDQVLIDLREG
jgi:hypothetical protein